MYRSFIPNHFNYSGVLLVGLLAGCASEQGPTMETLTLENTGYACMMDDGMGDTSTSAVQVTLSDCLSGCAHSLSASCEATVIDGSVVVTASGEYTVPTGEAVTCPSMCVELVADCDVSGIEEDTTTLSYADDEVPLNFPDVAGTCTQLAD